MNPLLLAGLLAALAALLILAIGYLADRARERGDR